MADEISRTPTSAEADTIQWMPIAAFIGILLIGAGVIQSSNGMPTEAAINLFANDVEILDIAYSNSVGAAIVQDNGENSLHIFEGDVPSMITLNGSPNSISSTTSGWFIGGDEGMLAHLDGETITRFDSLIELLLAFAVGCVIVLICRYSAYWFIAVALTLGAVGGLNYVTMAFADLVLFDITWILLTAFVVAFHSTFLRFILEFRLKQQIRKQFEKYLDPRQVAILVKNPEKLKLGGERKEMSFLFMDIVGFTPISEYYKNNDDPEGLVNVINDYLNRMSKIVLKNGGTIDKYMGDCIMAFWNAPLDCENHAEMAVKTSIECAEETDRIKKEFKEKGLPDINIGSGVNTGTCIVGNMGSEMRLDYSVIGDAVNLAARLEAATRNYKDDDGKVVPTLYSSYTKEQLVDIKSVEVDKIKVKGKEELITIYKPME